MLAIALAAIVAQPHGAIAQARIRIVQQVRVSERSWRSASRRSERLIVEQDGRISRLRTIDFE